MASMAPTFSDLSNTTITVTTGTTGGTADSIEGWYYLNDLAALRDIESTATNVIAFVDDLGDGSFGVYSWDDDATDADNGLSIIAPDDGGDGRWELRL